jgi:CheY-like chemotaxis protein
MKNFSSKEIRFSGDSIKSCVGFIDLVDSTKNTFVINNLEYTRKYYSKFINSTSEMIKNYNGKVIKNIGDCLLFYFPRTTNKSDSFREVLELGFKILDRRHSINQELSAQHLPPFNYRITMDYGLLDLALVGDYSQIDFFGSTINLCSKINSSTFSSPNDIIIGENLYRVLNSFSNMLNDYNFINIGQYKITELNRYSIYNIKRKSILDPNGKRKIGVENFINNKQLGDFSSNTNFDNTKNKNKKIILVDDEEDVLFTYKIFLENYDYDVTAFKDPILALDFIRDLANFDDPLIILDIRMKNLNGLQLYQQIKAIDSTLKIIFITALDIIDEFSTIIPGLSKEHIMRKPVDKKIFINTVKKLIK